MKEVLYKGTWLQRGSVAFTLFQEGKMDLLARHMKEVEQRHKELLSRYDKFEVKESQ